MSPDIPAGLDREIDSSTDFFAREPLATLGVNAASDVNQRGIVMTFGPFVSKLSVVTAYIAIAFVGAIVLGVF